MTRSMNTLERAHILKSARENGWEYCQLEDPKQLIIGSARHRAQVIVLPIDESLCWQLKFQGAAISDELRRTFPAAFVAHGEFTASTIGYLGPLLRRAAELAFALPNHGEALYKERVTGLIPSGTLGNTEVERMVRQRLGQDTYRELLLGYWGGACAVTGIDLPEVLRASHAKPWAECASDSERLDVYNGLLLVANLDALFDRGLITFTQSGDLLVSPHLDPEMANKMGCLSGARLRWLDISHVPYLAWHREMVWKA